MTIAVVVQTDSSKVMATSGTTPKLVSSANPIGIGSNSCAIGATTTICYKRMAVEPDRIVPVHE